ncbi:MAG: T9SS type A sorting domain-containing protein [Bacteroidales bacterium]|nr:T9SS type A sorting domain-containing protein [Bacteroidales bacterium]
MSQSLQSQNIAYVGDTLTSNKIWVKDTIYIVVQDLYIPLGISLVIEPGVTVKAQQYAGIFVEKGSLQVSGMNDRGVDSVYFVPNYYLPNEDWKWEGIIFDSVSNENDNYIEYARIEDTEMAVEINNSYHVGIRNCSIIRNQWRGIRIYNSNNCFISNCVISEGYFGIEMHVSGLSNTTSFNLVNECLVSGQSTGLKLSSVNRGLNTYNLISNSLFLENDNGIQFDNGISVYGKNFVEKNVIKNKSKFFGYGIQIGQDSMQVKDNIIWRNQTGIELRDAQHCDLSNNSLYENIMAVTIDQNSNSNWLSHNTLSENSQKSVQFFAYDNITYQKNNHFAPVIIKNSVYNGTTHTIEADLNYWGTTNDTEIQEMILDKFDNPSLGELIYQPFMELPDIECPVSPPLNVFKQLIGNTIKVTWTANKESDLQAYRIYYGDFLNYSFSQNLQVVGDTVAWLFDFPINDSIAVTALDDTISPGNIQLSGHESPFSFASIAPYAGEDFTICENLMKVELKDASAPFEFTFLNWTTSGDGTFDEIVLNPVYTPGPIDLVNNEVILTLKVTHNNTILVDSVKITFADNPIVELGNDTTIYNDEQLKLINSFASGYSRIQWFTAGDGIFSDSSVLHPVYIPGIIDLMNEKADLILIADSDCGVKSDTITVWFRPFSTINGKLWYNDQGFSDGVVVAFSMVDSTSAKPFQFVVPSMDGTFKFERLFLGDYLIAAIPDTTQYDALVPSYYVDKKKWQEAYRLTLTDTIYDIDIQMQKSDYQLPVGVGSISGHFIKPPLNSPESAVYCTSWFESNSMIYCDEGLSNVSVLLYTFSHDKLLAYTLTDAKGNFIFDGLPFGKYSIEVEIPGYFSEISPTVILSPENSAVEEITFAIENKKVVINYLDKPISFMPVVLPNPASDFITIFVLSGTESPVELEIYNAVGQIVYTSTEQLTMNVSQYFTIDISKLTDGIYFGRMQTQPQNQAFTFIKKSE